MKQRRPEAVARIRRIALGLARSIVAVALLMTAYYLAPLDTTPDVGTWIGFVAALGAVALMFAVQVRAILDSDMPRLRGVETMLVGLVLLLLLFAAAYTVMSNADSANFDEPLTRSDSLYFTVTVFATVGFGDIVPVSETARLITTGQMVVGLIALGLVAKIVLSAVQLAVQRRAHTDKNGHDNDDTDGHGEDGEPISGG
ncbi:potassium channel family protein [Prauserella cavernicola]|uniref:Two pore domain potassium channel family protein n=1 Tax=Prauserella cavernicola TaxID=2800127 RepID=A0A934QVK6_9PSEU|nr:potassium channel family protein [Prauserella cavernicola]MBK1787022.1 two pore domain potassium channel family protein [Prauserella cavernicola]